MFLPLTWNDAISHFRVKGWITSTTERKARAMGTVTIHRTFFTEDDVRDGDYSRDVTTTEVYEVSAREAADLLTREGLKFAATGNDWAADPDGSRIVDYATGRREDTSGHLAGFPERVVRAIMDAVG